MFESMIVAITVCPHPTRKAGLLAYLAQMHTALGLNLHTVASSTEITTLTVPQIKRLVKTMEDHIKGNTSDAEWKLDRIRGKALDNEVYWTDQVTYTTHYRY